MENITPSPQMAKLQCMTSHIHMLSSFLEWCMDRKHIFLLEEAIGKQFPEDCDHTIYARPAQNIQELIVEYLGIDTEKLKEETEQTLVFLKSIKRLDK